MDKKIETTYEEIQKNIVCQEPIPTLFIDGFQGMGVSGSTIRLNLIEDKLDPQQEKIVRHVIMRLIMPFEIIDSLIEKLSKLRNDAMAAQIEILAKVEKENAGK